MSDRFDVVVVGGGHNGLVAAAYLAREGRRVLVLEAREVLGGAAGTIEFLPGYFASFTNSPGSFDGRIIADLALEEHGLRFLRPDPTLVHPFPSGAFVGFRDQRKVDEQLDRLAAGESTRYRGLLSDLEALGRALGVSLYSPSPSLAELGERMSGHPLEPLYRAVFEDSLENLLCDRLASDEARTLLGMIALNGNLFSPREPGSAVGLMLRPISMASGDSYDITSAPLRGSSGLPIGGMGAVIDALASVVRAHGGVIRTSAPVQRLLFGEDRVRGVVDEAGDEILADAVIATLAPPQLAALLQDDSSGTAEDLSQPITGSAFKIVLALDGQPEYAGLPDGLSAETAGVSQFRIAPSFDYLRRSVEDGIAGRPTGAPIMWGLMVTRTSPGLAPPGCQLLSVNAWHAPYRLAEGRWDEQRTNAFGERCLDELETLMPNIRAHLIGQRFMGPEEVERETLLPGSNITHGDMRAESLFGNRPYELVRGARTPLRGLYIGGSGSWPGGYITGIPGRSAGKAVLADLVNLLSR